MRILYLSAGWPCAWAGDYFCAAMSDDGTVLASHVCSSAGFMYGDLYGRRPERKAMWEEHFGGPEGEAFQVVDLGYDLPPADVLELNRQQPDGDGAA